MHDEENAIGLTVQNPAGETWKCFGDKRALDLENSDNQKRCLAALQASATEIYEAYRTKTLPDKYAAWTHAPTLASVSPETENQLLAPLFLGDKRRSDLQNRRRWEHTLNWTALGTVVKCEFNGWWNYPITIDGPNGMLSGSGIAATATSDGDGSGNIYL